MSVRLPFGATAFFVASLFAPLAMADPCKAIPDNGPLPAYLSKGATFSGPVVYVGDGDGLCVAQGADPSTWIEVRLANFYAPELHETGGERAKLVLSRLVIGRRVTCRAQKRSYDRVVAECQLAGVSIAELMRSEGVAEGGRGLPIKSYEGANFKE